MLCTLVCLLASSYPTLSPRCLPTFSRLSLVYRLTPKGLKLVFLVLGAPGRTHSAQSVRLFLAINQQLQWIACTVNGARSTIAACRVVEASRHERPITHDIGRFVSLLITLLLANDCFGCLY